MSKAILHIIFSRLLKPTGFGEDSPCLQDQKKSIMAEEPIDQDKQDLRRHHFEIEYGRHIEGLYGIESKDSYRRGSCSKWNFSFYKLY